jgi:hypothetical protein
VTAEVEARAIFASHLEEFVSWCRDRGAQLERGVADILKKPLYHYTGLAALKGIIGNQEFWFTDILHLNDPSEFRHGTEMVLSMMGKHPLRSDVLVNFLCEPLEQTLREHHELLDIYVASFSGLNDDLSQWRAYGAGGKGCAIELAPTFFVRSANWRIGPDSKQAYRIVVVPMIYDEDVMRGRLLETLDKAFETFAGMRAVFALTPPEKGLEFLSEFASKLATEIFFEVLLAKHPAYRAETELRLSILLPRPELAPPIETRARGGQTIRFVRQKLDVRKDISGVILGPLADAETERAAKELLAACDLDADRLIRLSKVPMR